MTLHRSYHVATLDHDRDEVARRSVEFVRLVAPTEPAGEEGGDGEEPYHGGHGRTDLP